MEKLQNRLHVSRVLSALFIVFISIALTGILILIDGKNPVEVLRILFLGAFGSFRAIANSLATSTPLIFTGLSVAVAFKAGAFNIGSEGQMALGGIAAALVGVYVNGLPPLFHVLLAIAAAMIAGGIWAFIPGILKVRYRVNEVVGTLMANYIAILLCNYIVTFPFRYQDAPMGMSPNIQNSAKLSAFIPLTRFGWSFVIAVVITLFTWWLYKKTVLGREMIVVGSNPRFAEYIGLNSDHLFLKSMFFSGALAGIGGAVLVLGVQYRYVQDITASMGFDGVPIALIASNNPIGVLFVSIAFGALRVGGLKIDGISGVPFELTQVIQALIILMLAGRMVIAPSKNRKKGLQKVKRGV